MTILQTVLIYVGIPAAVIAAVAGLIYGTGGKQTKRYRPGREYDFAPVWFLARPEQVSVAAAADYVADLSDENAPKQLESAATNVRTGIKGGASGNW